MPYQLVVIKGRSSSQTLKVSPDGVTTVGRQDGCQIRISSSQVSRKHCELFEKKGLLLVKDLGSSNGTFVNGKKIEGQQVLEPGNMLTVGAVTFRVERTDVPGAGAPETGRKPSDTAVSEAVGAGASGGEDDLEIDFEVEVEDETQHDSSPDVEDLVTQPAAKIEPAADEADVEEQVDLDGAEVESEPTPAAAEPAASAEPSEPAKEPEAATAEQDATGASEEEAAPEIGEDAVAEYLLNIDLDDEDKL